MSKIDVIRAWKDAEYRDSLSAAERAQLPQNPAGLIEVSTTELAATSGGDDSFPTVPTMTEHGCTGPGGCGKVVFNPTIVINPGFRLMNVVAQRAIGVAYRR